MAVMMKLDLRREHQKYFNKAGQQVKGVTTILGVLGKEALIPWAASEEREGIIALMETNEGAALGDMWSATELRKHLPRNAKGDPAWFYTIKRDKAADLGTIAHAHIEARLAGTTLDPDGLDPDLYQDALLPAERFFGWVDGQKVALVKSEFQMVSEAWQVGGTCDCVFSGPGKELQLWDVKTSKPFYSGRPYDEMYAQTAAYAAMYEEATGDTITSIKIARVGKTKGDNGDLHDVTDYQRKCGLELFLAAKHAYEAKSRLK